MWRDNVEDETPMQTTPKAGRGDFVEAIVRRLSKNEYTAVDKFGNTLSLDAQLAAKIAKKTTKIITSLASRQIRTFTEAMDVAPVLSFYHERKIRRFIEITEKKEKRSIEQIGFHRIPDADEDWTNEEHEIYRRISFQWNTKLVDRSVSKKVSGLYLYSTETSLGKTALLRTIAKLENCFIHCLSDGGWQEEYDVDAIGDSRYKAYLIDAINTDYNFNFSNLETLSDADVKLMRRGTTPGTLVKNTPFMITSNITPEELFGERRGQILRARCMVVNCNSIALFKQINIINQVHELPAYVQDNIDIPSDNDMI